MTLIFMRHGEAAATSADPPLTPLGRTQAATVARLVRRTGARPSRIVHSGLRRAAETAQELAVAYGNEPPLAVAPGLQPDEDAAAWVAGLAELSEDLAVVSHQPFLTRLCGLLLSGHEALRPVEFRTATAAVLAREDSRWILRHVIHTPA